MRYWLVLLLLPLAAANPDHGESATDTVLYVHHLGGDLAIHAEPPTAWQLMDASDRPEACGTSLTWSADLTQAPIGDEVEWTEGLARDALFKGSLRLTWFFERVEPGGSTPWDVPLPEAGLNATIRAGPDGDILAVGGTRDTPTSIAIDGRYVYRMTTSLRWTDEARILATDGLRLEVSLDTGHGVPGETCRTAPLGVRAYGGPDALSRIEGKLFDAILIDRIEPVTRHDGILITVHASSPWGRFDVATPQATLVGPAGQIDLADPVDISNETALGAGWLLPTEQALNGTYRVEATVQNLIGTEVSESTLFKLGNEEPASEPVVEPETKQSPGPFALLIVGLALLSRVSR